MEKPMPQKLHVCRGALARASIPMMQAGRFAKNVAIGCRFSCFVNIGLPFPFTPRRLKYVRIPLFLPF